MGLFLCTTTFSAVVPISKQTLQLRPGWNLVTLIHPLESMQSNVNKFLSLKPMAYDADRRCYVACNRAEDIKAGDGYWIFSNNSQAVELALDSKQTAGQMALKAGWNLVGVMDKASWANSAVHIWAWKNGHFAQVTEKELQAGNAYWIYMN